MDSATATPRRSQRIQELSSPPSGSSSPSTQSKTDGKLSQSTVMSARRSPFLPTPLETILLSIYPATLIIGSLFSLLNPTARSSTYNAATPSDPSSTPPSYFAKKSNIFNIFFVKQGWAWITVSYFLFLFTHPSTGPPRSLVVTPRRVRGVVRWSIVTVWWIFVTQWFFGPAIIDRGFLLTGGQCELVEEAAAGNVDMDHTRHFFTAVACKTVGGKWKGGHDISGHVFLLVLGSMFLLEEVLHVVLKSARAKEERTIIMRDGAVKSAEVEVVPAVYTAEEDLEKWNLGVKFVLGVAGLSIYMLAMTAAYFHTWFEKFTGLLVALCGIFVAYFLPRAIPALRSIVGMPGV